MKRSLVLTTESARHPFRRSLPPRVWMFASEDLAADAQGDSEAPQESALSFFIGCFLIGFVAIYGFIA